MAIALLTEPAPQAQAGRDTPAAAPVQTARGELTPASLLLLQRTAGNRAVSSLLERRALQRWSWPWERDDGPGGGGESGGGGASGSWDDAPSEQAPAPEPARPVSVATGEDECARCLEACRQGGEAFRNFCRSLSDPRLRAGCWALQFASVVACNGWCYWHFCD